MKNEQASHDASDESPNGFDQVIVTSRPLAEYRAMFGLTEEDLGLGFLDCAAGASSFTAELSRRGGSVTACDPLYRRYRRKAPDPDRLRADILAGDAYVRRNADDYVWTFHRTPDDHLRRRLHAAQAFAHDIQTRPEGYVPCSLPDLPFEDDAVDVVLCSHLLFSYPALFSYDFHLRSIRQMCRVAAREVRIFPLLSAADPSPYPELDRLRGDLERAGVSTEVRAVPYEFQRGGNEMLVCRPAAE
jgi:ubiquinone/menaquinone biosynthesis C-methylase UbiE